MTSMARSGTILSEAHKGCVPASHALQLADLLKLPWKPKDSSLRLDDYGFYLAVLSPNVGRVALREWIADSLEMIKGRLNVFLESTRIVSPGAMPRARFPSPPCSGQSRPRTPISHAVYCAPPILATYPRWLAAGSRKHIPQSQYPAKPQGDLATARSRQSLQTRPVFRNQGGKHNERTRSE